MSIKSVVRAGDVLAALASGSASRTLKDIAAQAHMPAGQAHKYLSSLIEIGLARRDAETGRYGLGPMALDLGLAAMTRLSFLEETQRAARTLCDALGLTGHVSVWGPQGPVIVRLFEGGPSFVSTLGLGVVAPLLRSATGQVFLAYAPAARVATVLAAERAASRPAPDDAEIARLVETIRHRRCARVSGTVMPGLAALAVPVLDWQDEICCSVTLVSTEPETLADGSEAARRLDETCRALSARLGAGRSAGG